MVTKDDDRNSLFIQGFVKLTISNLGYNYRTIL